MGTPELEIGTGPEDGAGFATLSPGQSVPLTFGLQQGFHVWTNLRARNLCFSQLKIKRTAHLVETGTLIVTAQEQLSLVAASDPQLAQMGWGQLPTSVPSFMCPNPIGLDIPGHTVELSAEVTDREGRTASAKKTLVPFCAPNSVQDLCSRQCAPSTTFDAGADG